MFNSPLKSPPIYEFFNGPMIKKKKNVANDIKIFLFFMIMDILKEFFSYMSLRSHEMIII